MSSVPMEDMNGSSPQLMEEDEQAPYPLEQRSRPRKRAMLACALVCCVSVILCAGLVSTVITLSVLLSHENHVNDNFDCPTCPEPSPYVCEERYGPNYFGPLIRNTTEYQIKLIPADWSHREARVEEWMSVVAANNKFFLPDEAHMKTSCRHQWDLHLNDCGTSVQIRARSYYDGDEVGLFYADTKANSRDLSVCAEPFDGASKYLLNTSQKCERDVHECPGDDKHSRETRIFFQDYEPPMETCGQCAELFPDVFADLSASDMDNATPTKAHTYWWVREYEGYLNASTRYLIAFTVSYSKQEDTIDPVHYPYYGEWSIRLHTLGDGLVDQWDEEVVAETEKMYQALQDQFTVGDPC